MKILIITGGADPEREISWLSAVNIEASLLRLGYEVKTFDYSDGDKKLKKLASKFDLAFPIMHGKQGESGELQKKLEEWGVKFLGPTSKTCFDAWSKDDFKKFCEEENIRTPQWQLVHKVSEISLDLPLVIKAVDDGSTVDVFVAKSKRELNSEKISDAFKRRGVMLIEEYIKGVEVTSGIWGEKVLPLLEIVPPEGEMFDFENKYNGKSKEIPFPPSLSEEMQKRVQSVTEKVRKALNVRDFSRVDYMVRGEEIFVLELNIIPGMTSESLLPKEIKAAGMTMEEALDNLIKSHSN